MAMAIMVIIETSLVVVVIDWIGGKKDYQELLDTTKITIGDDKYQLVVVAIVGSDGGK